jgi:hypothetical protein
MRAVGACIGDVENVDEWRFRIKVTELNSWEKGEKEEEEMF